MHSPNAPKSNELLLQAFNRVNCENSSLVSVLWGSRVADYELDAGVSWLDNVMELRPVVGPSVIVLVTCPTIRSGPSHRGHFKEYFRGWTGKLNW